MKSHRRLFTILASMVVLVTWLIVPEAYGQTIPEFIELNKNNAETVLNKRPCDRNAKIFYLDFAFCSPGSTSLQRQTKHLIKAAKKIQKKGAEILICVYNLTQEDILKNAIKQAKSCNIKCPIINTANRRTREIIYGHSLLTATSNLMVVNANGQWIYEFRKDGDTIIMKDKKSGENRPFPMKKVSSQTWVSDVILASYEDLVRRVEEETTGPEEQNPPAEEEDEEEPRKTTRQEKAPHWKRVNVDE